jgi:signal transduction histidine kinase
MTQARLIEDLIDQSRITNGMLRISPEPVDALQLATEVVESVRPLAAERRIEIVVRGPGSASACADPDRLRQVVRNLVTNAVDYSLAGSRVEVEIGRAEGRLYIRVRDRGIGIAPSFLPFVFERFQREERSRAKGLGLGLAIAREIVELHGGRIVAESAGKGLGSTFTVSLPDALLEPGCVAVGS